MILDNGKKVDALVESKDIGGFGLVLGLGIGVDWNSSFNTTNDLPKRQKPYLDYG